MADLNQFLGGGGGKYLKYSHRLGLSAVGSLTLPSGYIYKLTKVQSNAYDTPISVNGAPIGYWILVQDSDNYGRNQTFWALPGFKAEITDPQQSSAQVRIEGLAFTVEDLPL